MLQSTNTFMESTIDSLVRSRNLWIPPLIVLFLYAIFRSNKTLPAGSKRLPRLPGLPYIGRIWGLPPSNTEIAWHFADYHKKYGPMYEWLAMGELHVWIGKDSIARDLLVKRAKLYGDRHELPAAVGIKGGSEILPLMGIGEAFFRHRNFIHNIMRESSLQFFYEYPIIENALTLRRFLDAPDRWSENIVTHCSRAAARIAWGDPKHATKLLTLVPKLLKAISPGAGPLPNKLPFLQLLPTALSPFKQAEAKRKLEMEEAYYEAQKEVEAAVLAGTAEDSWMKIWFEKSIERGKLDQHEAAHAVGNNALVAIATIGSPLHTFMIAMCHYPSWLLRLQQEMDGICGDSRLPTFQDISNTPVLRAIVKELIRWRQAVPAGVPHVTTEDDVYDGYFIPKGTMIHANHFAITRDEELFPDPVNFHPERWLEASWPTYKEPLTEYPNLRGDVAFGYGIRSCLGIDLTAVELYTLVGALAWAFDIKRPEGLRGYQNPVPWYEMNPFAITVARHFQVDISPRSEFRAQFIRAGCPDAPVRLIKERQDSMVLESPTATRWDVHVKKGSVYDWGGLTVGTGIAPPRSYSPGV